MADKGKQSFERESVLRRVTTNKSPNPASPLPAIGGVIVGLQQVIIVSIVELSELIVFLYRRNMIQMRV